MGQDRRRRFISDIVEMEYQPRFCSLGMLRSLDVRLPGLRFSVPRRDVRSVFVGVVIVVCFLEFVAERQRYNMAEDGLILTKIG